MTTLRRDKTERAQNRVRTIAVKLCDSGSAFRRSNLLGRSTRLGWVDTTLPQVDDAPSETSHLMRIAIASLVIAFAAIAALGGDAGERRCE